MRARVIFPVLCGLSLLASACGGTSDGDIGASLAAQQLQSQGIAASSRVLVKFKPGTSTQAIQSYERDRGAVALRTIPDLGISVLQVKGVFPQTDDPHVDFEEPDRLRKATWLPDAPQYGSQWGLQRVDAPQAWNITLGNPNVVVAVVDTGIDLTHPNLRSNLVPGISFVNQIQGPSGAPGDTSVVPVANNGPMDDNAHGTNVAGIIAAADNGTGVVGVAPRCRLMPVKVLGYNGEGFDSDIANGIVWAVDHGARVINLSLGGEGGSQTLAAAVAYAIDHDVVVCAAMGNDGDKASAGYGTHINYPAAYPGVIAVGATDQQDQPAKQFASLTFSNRGRWITLCAPGLNILSTTPTYPVFDSEVDSRYGTMSGTSQATPFVSGAAALLLSVAPHLTPGQVKTILEETADDVGTPGFDSYTGYGRLNIYKALLKAIQTQ